MFVEIETILLRLRRWGECQECSEHFVQLYVGSRCPAVNWVSAASVSNVDWPPPAGRQLHGEPTG